MKALKIILAPIFFVLFLSCQAQDKKQPDENYKTKPDENIKVNKEYDEYGNLIRYDSIYTYSYSSNNKLNDSIRGQFQQHFNKHSIFDDAFFNDFFEPDSLPRGFNHENFFFDGFINQDESILNIMKRMDSIQQLFFDKHRKAIIPAEPEK